MELCVGVKWDPLYETPITNHIIGKKNIFRLALAFIRNDRDLFSSILALEKKGLTELWSGHMEG